MSGERLLAEIEEAPDAVRRQASVLGAPLADLARFLRGAPPQVVVTCARGSSAHAATFAKHLIEHRLGIPVAAAAPNIASVYRRRLRLDSQLFLAISQSGRSDDLVALMESAKDSGALCVALVNDTASPLANASDLVLDMAAGPEKSVPATKTFIASLAALLRLAAAWTDDRHLSASLDRLPQRLGEAAALDWSAAADTLAAATSTIAIGRGPTLAIAREAALKLKETCNIHAEAFSGAEFLHGPIAMVGRDFPVMMFMPGDEAGAGMRQLATDLREAGAAVLTAGAGENASTPLAGLAADHPDADVLCLIQSFYAMVVDLAARRGLDIDRPRHIEKVTRTL